MSDSLKAGSVYVAVTASIGEFTKSMAQVVKQVEETAAKVKESAEFVAGVGALFAAGITLAVDQASKANAALSRDVERLKKLLYTLAGDLGDLFAPAVREVTQALERVVGLLQTLDPGVKQALASFALFAAGTGVVAAGVAGAAGLVEGLAKMLALTLVPALKAASSVLPLLGPALKQTGQALAQLKSVDVFTSLSSGAKGLKAALLGLPGQVMGLGKSFLSLVPQVLAVAAPLAAVVAAVVGIALGAGAVYEAWNDTSTGLRASVLDAVEALKGYAARLGAFFRDIFTSLRDLFLGIAAAALETVLAQVRTAAAAFEKLAHAAGATTLETELAKLQSLTGASMVQGLTDTMKAAGEAAGEALAKGVDFVADVGKSAAANVAESLSYSVKGLKRMLGDAGKASGVSVLLAKMQDMLDRLMGAKAKQRDEEDDGKGKPEVEVSRVGQGKMDLGTIARGETSSFMKAVSSSAAYVEAKAIREAMLAAQAAAKEMREAAREAFTSKLTARTGNVQGLVESGAQGAAMGGPVGAAVAVGLDLITQSQGFAEIIGMVNTVIQQVADALGSFLVPLQPLIAAVLRLVPIIANALGPVFNFIGQLLEPLVPVFYVLGEVLEVLAPLLQMFSGAIELLTLPLRLIVDTGLRLLFEGIKYLGVGVLGVARGISWLWNGVVEGVQWVLRGLANLPFLGALNDVADALEDVKVDREALKQSQEELLNLSYEQARAKAAETAATMKNTAALKVATESLTNVPAAWKVAQRRFEAQDARTGSPLLLPVAGASSAPTSAATSSAPSSAQAAPAQAAAPAIAIGTLNVSGEDTGRALSQLERHLDNLAFRNRGTRAQPGRYAVVEGG